MGAIAEFHQTQMAIDIIPSENSGPARTAAISVQDLAKDYSRSTSLGRWLLRGIRADLVPAEAGEDRVAALTEVSFTVAKGEAFGVIGRNGAGKSTLLQVLAGTLRATRGTCAVRGRVTALARPAPARRARRFRSGPSPCGA